MDLFTILGACLRRWYVTVPIVVVAGYFAQQAYEAVPSEYTSSVSIVVLPSNTPDPVDEAAAAVLPDNPYSGSGGPRFAAVVLARNINTEAYRERIGLDGAQDITFEAIASTEQPIIAIDAFGPTPEVVASTLDAVAGQAEVVLRDFQTQAGAPEERLYRIAPAVPADRVEDVTPSRFRTAGAIGVIGLALAGIVGTAVDVVVRRWRTGRDEMLAAREVDRSEGEEDEGVENPTARSATIVATPSQGRPPASALEDEPLSSRPDRARSGQAPEAVRGR